MQVFPIQDKYFQLLGYLHRVFPLLKGLGMITFNLAVAECQMR